MLIILLIIFNILIFLLVITAVVVRSKTFQADTQHFIVGLLGFFESQPILPLAFPRLLMGLLWPETRYSCALEIISGIYHFLSLKTSSAGRSK